MRKMRIIRVMPAWDETNPIIEGKPLTWWIAHPEEVIRLLRTIPHPDQRMADFESIIPGENETVDTYFQRQMAARPWLP